MATMSFSTFIAKASAKHKSFYTYESKDFKGASQYVTIYCPNHGPFKQRGSNHLQGDGCKKCSHSKLSERSRTPFLEYAEKVAENFGGEVSVDEGSYRGTKYEVQAYCKTHGKFTTQALRLLGTVGCKKCHNLAKDTSRFALPVDDFKRRAGELHEWQYIYDLSTYEDLRSYISFECFYHGSFRKRADRHLEGKGCPYCALSESNVLPLEELRERVLREFGDGYQISGEIYGGISGYVEFVCEVHGKKISSTRRLLAHGCIECTPTGTRGERRVRKFLIDRGIVFVEQWSHPTLKSAQGRRLRVDFAIPPLKTLIEFDGAQHREIVPFFGGAESFKLALERDLLKNEWSKTNGWVLVRIDSVDEIEVALRGVAEKWGKR